MIIGNGKLITNDTENHILKMVLFVSLTSLLMLVGDFEELKKKYPEDDVLDVKGRVIMPGLINAHTHIYAHMPAAWPSPSLPEFPGNSWTISGGHWTAN